MKKYLLLFTVMITMAVLKTNAQFTRYIIRFKDKTGTPYSINNPSQFLTQRSIDRRARYGIPVDETDLPITPRYLDSIQAAGAVTIINVSKWLNQLCISTTDAAALSKINAFDFVLTAAPIAARITPSGAYKNKLLDAPAGLSTTTPAAIQNINDVYDYGLSYDQVHLHNADFLHNHGFRGQGMQVAVIDDGFANFLTLPTFDSVRNNHQILGTWDFVTNDSSVNEDDNHGMKCFSTIAANMPGSFVGTAPAASFYLYRTEDLASEYPVEEQNWAAAAERADSLGVDIFSTSLGYTTFSNSLFNHTYADLDGNTTIMARAANLAAKKGILPLAAAGNDGNAPWHYLSTGGDADSALTVGAVTLNRQVPSFSSYGPNSDGQIKPDVAAIGSNAVVAGTNSGQPVYGNGTSFATPIMAGITTCLWQAFPEIKNMDIIQGLRQSADHFETPDDRRGYGVPDVKKAFVDFIKQLHTNTATFDNCNAQFNLGVKAAADMNVTIERLLPSDTNYLTIATFSFNGDFAKRIFTYTDPLANFTSGVNIKYRYKMVIGADTSFYLDSATLNYEVQCASVTERKICPNSATYFSVDSLPAGFAYQWQVDTGTGFSDIINNSIYSGTSARILILKNIPQNFYGFKYRCVQTNGSTSLLSTPVTLKFSSDWTGSFSTAWEDSRNWSCGVVPSQYIDAVIAGESSNFPLINTSAVCHSLTTSAGTSITVNNGGKLNIAGN